MFKVLIIEDNHSFIDSLKVMLRDLPLEFSHAFRYADAQAIMDKSGIFYNREVPQGDGANAETEQPEPTRKKHAHEPKLYNDGGVFLIIVEQNTESSMKGTDFMAHAVRKYPGLSEGDFVVLTHRLELVPARNQNFAVLEKPLRAPQIRQIVQQKIKQAQDTVEAQAQASRQKHEKPEKAAGVAKPARKGLRDLLKISREPEAPAETPAEEKKTAAAKKTKKAAVEKKPAKPARNAARK